MPFVSVVKSHNTGLAERAADAGQGVLAAEPLARMRFAPPLARWLTSGSGLWYLARALSQRADPALKTSRQMPAQGADRTGLEPRAAGAGLGAGAARLKQRGVRYHPSGKRAGTGPRLRPAASRLRDRRRRGLPPPHSW